MRVWRAALVLLLPTIALAQDPDDAAQVNARQADALRGRERFAQTCGFCHGRDARGASGPDLIRSPLVNRDVDGNLIGEVVRNGRPAKGMPAFALSGKEIHELAAFLHGETDDAASVARKMPTDYPLAKLLVGDASHGKTYFNGHCTKCHSTSGDFAHIASKYKPFDLQTKIAYPGGGAVHVRVHTASEDAEGEQIYADEFYVSLRDSHGRTRTFRRDSAEITISNSAAEHEHLLKLYSDSDLHDLFAYLESFR